MMLQPASLTSTGHCYVVTSLNAHANPSLQTRKLRPGVGQLVESARTWTLQAQGSCCSGLGCLP